MTGLHSGAWPVSNRVKPLAEGQVHEGPGHEAHVPDALKDSSCFPKYAVDLDMPPSQRWAHIAREYQEAAQTLEAAYKTSLADAYGCFG